MNLFINFTLGNYTSPTYLPDIFQVGFKLLSETEVEELTDIAYHHRQKNNSNFTVGNSVYERNFNTLARVIISPKKEVFLVSLQELAPKLVKKVCEKILKQSI
ncbi:hypothetical protein HYX13_03685 [Candidatus Woesearchaeota archaeon]|nr:hypothetical protein [Candidatus Woesearchaeota archaeon]